MQLKLCSRSHKPTAVVPHGYLSALCDLLSSITNGILCHLTTLSAASPQVSEARPILEEAEVEKQFPNDVIVKEAIRLAEQVCDEGQAVSLEHRHLW